MTDPIKDLLAVLDAKDPEKKLQGWAWRNNRDLWRDLDGGGFCRFSLADLAFRLRDEAVNRPSEWRKAKHLVYWHRMGECADTSTRTFHVNCQGHFTDYAPSISWIIAALITKQLAKEKK